MAQGPNIHNFKTKGEHMKKLGKSAFTVVLFVTAIVTTIYAQQYPKANGFVNDFANLLTHEQGVLLNNELIAFEKKTEIEIAVITVPWLNNQSIEDYTQGIAKEWGVGKRNQNNGVVFLIAPKERKMRIETASGIRAILTNNHTDHIRDNEVLPHFRSGKIAQGIIDGTHAIMNVLDANTIPTTSKRKRVDAPLLPQREWTSNNTKKLVYIISSIAGIILMLVVIIPPIQHSNAYKYVLKTKDRITLRFPEVESMSTNSDVNEETRNRLKKLKSEFFSIDWLTTTKKNDDWLERRNKLRSMNDELSRIIHDINKEVAFAKKARKEGPELLKKIPDIIKAAEQKLAEGKPSKEALEHLREARAQYTYVTNQYSGMTVIDWVALYIILRNIQSNTTNAELKHQLENPVHFENHSSSYGFGNKNGFGGGGGFDKRGGGSSGSW